jgi:HPt (histidine-containing phosphotransfer) domain-containing protein
MLIDKDKFRENFEFFDKEIVLDIINMFIDEYPERMQKIKQNIDDKDFENLKFNAHSLKGVIANFVADDATAVAKALENKGKNQDPEGIDELYQTLVEKTGQVVEELKELKKDFV